MTGAERQATPSPFYYMPIADACTLNNSKLLSPDFVISCLLKKLFNTNCILSTQHHGFEKPMARRVRKFDFKFVTSEKSICKLLSGRAFSAGS